MYQQKLFSLKELQDCFEAIEPELIRYPALDADTLRGIVAKFIESLECELENEQS
jgi:hypothetical protein